MEDDPYDSRCNEDKKFLDDDDNNDSDEDANDSDFDW